MLGDLKQQLPQYVAAAANAPAFDKGSVADYTNASGPCVRIMSMAFAALAAGAWLSNSAAPNATRGLLTSFGPNGSFFLEGSIFPYPYFC